MEDETMVDIGQMAAAAPTRQLLNLPHEILQNLLQHCDCWELATLSQVCTSLRDFVRDNDLLWKKVYLNHFDVPRYVPEQVDWRNEVQSFARSLKLLRSEDLVAKRAARVPVANIIIKLLKNTSSDAESSLNLRLLKKSFESSNNQDCFLCGSSLFGLLDSNAEWQVPESVDERQLLAQLHCLYGVPRYGWDDEDAGLNTIGFARARVYNLGLYTGHTRWGPFMDNDSGDIDWEKIEAIMIVLGYNMKVHSDRSNGRWPELWTADRAWNGASPYSLTSGGTRKSDNHPDDEDSEELQRKLELQDPYGITGEWHRIVCFLDYYDFFHFNFRSEEPGGLPATHLSNDEAIRFIKMRFRVTKVEPQADGVLPIVHFAGDSCSMLNAHGDPNANSDIIGLVRQTPQGEIRWTTWSIYHSEKRWRSEGIQVGGIQSGRGIIGNWFDTDYDRHGPAGPTTFWRVSDQIDDEHHDLDKVDKRLQAASIGTWVNPLDGEFDLD